MIAFKTPDKEHQFQDSLIHKTRGYDHHDPGDEDGAPRPKLAVGCKPLPDTEIVITKNGFIHLYDWEEARKRELNVHNALLHGHE